MKALIAGIGNVFFGDDGFGSEVIRALAGEDLGAGVRVRDFGIGGFHLALEMLEPYETIVFVDALARDAAPGTLFLVEPDLNAPEAAPVHPDAHAMDVGAVLALYRRVRADMADAAEPAIAIVGCVPKSTAPHIGLSDPVRAAIPACIALIRSVLIRTQTGAMP